MVWGCLSMGTTVTSWLARSFSTYSSSAWAGKPHISTRPTPPIGRVVRVSPSRAAAVLASSPYSSKKSPTWFKRMLSGWACLTSFSSSHHGARELSSSAWGAAGSAAGAAGSAAGGSSCTGTGIENRSKDICPSSFSVAWGCIFFPRARAAAASLPSGSFGTSLWAWRIRCACSTFWASHSAFRASLAACFA